MTGKRILSGVAPGAIIFALISAPAAAQETAQTTAATGNQPIIVTAQRREQQLQDVPLAVTALSDGLLEDNVIRDVADLDALAPSITYTQSSNQLQSGIRIRGIGTQVFSQSVEPSVSFVVDGVVLARQGQALTDLIDIERVEVLRGPQGTLFGKNASAGVINIVTQRPTDTLSGRFSALYAEGDEYELRGTISGPLSANIGARLTAFHRDRPGHIDNLFDGRELNGNRSTGARAQLEFEAGDRLNLLFIGDYSESEADCCQWQVRSSTSPGFSAQLAPVVPSDTNTQTNVRANVQADAENWGVSLEANYDFDSHTLTSITAYREWDFSNNTDVDSTPVIAGGYSDNDGLEWK